MISKIFQRNSQELLNTGTTTTLLKDLNVLPEPPPNLNYVTELELVAALEDAGIHVVFLPYPLPGAYWHHERLIVVDARLSPTWQWCTLAHEAVHAWFGHDGPCEPAKEAGVDEYAAGLLVSEAGYRLAERLHGNNIHAIADELDVTDWIVEAYRRTLRRVA